MCGIYGYIGTSDAREAVFTGLTRLDYRGYDSWGIAVAVGEALFLEKAVGEVQQTRGLGLLPYSRTGLGHTRWATHGAVTQVNAHPHMSRDNKFALVHNGIVENFEELKRQLVQNGISFVSQTDTEVIVRLIELNLAADGDYTRAILKTAGMLKGRNTFGVLTSKGVLYGYRNGSPLLVGKGKKGMYMSSDTLSFAHAASEMAVIDNETLIEVDGNDASVIEEGGRQSLVQFEPLVLKDHHVDKRDYPHFMIKEIHETAEVIVRVSKVNRVMMADLTDRILQAHQVYTIGSGTSGIAAEQMAYYLRTIASKPAIALIGAEASSYLQLLTNQDVIIAPSQSGETADVLEVLEVARDIGATLVTYVNMPGSSMARMADYAFEIDAGPEVCVMATKVFSAKLAWGYLLAHSLAGTIGEARKSLRDEAKLIHGFLEKRATQVAIRKLAEELCDALHIFLLGKGQNLAVVREGMVKIIEGSYIHAHGMAAGDLKHFAITIMQPGVPVLFCISDDGLQADVLAAVAEVGARGAVTIGIGPRKFRKHFDRFVAIEAQAGLGALSNTVVMQLLAYNLALAKGNPIDKPRHIAKSVTVK
jgi:glutamine---fructose-6-phosphate transaminase (isomerizing)